MSGRLNEPILLFANLKVFAPTVFRQAGYSAYKADFLSGLNNTLYIVATLTSVFTLDRFGRRKMLYIGAVAMVRSSHLFIVLTT